MKIYTRDTQQLESFLQQNGVDMVIFHVPILLSGLCSQEFFFSYCILTTIHVASSGPSEKFAFHAALCEVEKHKI